MVDFALAGDLVVVDAFGPIPPDTILAASRRRKPGLDAEKKAEAEILRPSNEDEKITLLWR